MRHMIEHLPIKWFKGAGGFRGFFPDSTINYSDFNTMLTCCSKQLRPKLGFYNKQVLWLKVPYKPSNSPKEIDWTEVNLNPWPYLFLSKS